MFIYNAKTIICCRCCWLQATSSFVELTCSCYSHLMLKCTWLFRTTIFVFPGVRMRQELLEGKTPGTDGDVIEYGWSNRQIFQKYLGTHLIKYLPERSTDRAVLSLYDGHKSHVNLSLIYWTKKENIILSILPAHTSHVLQPMDVACFGPFQKYTMQCHISS